MEETYSKVVMWESDLDRHIVQSPAVGVFSEGPPNGVFLTGGAKVGRLKILNTYFDLYLPDDLYGQVNAGDRDFSVPMAYGEELFRLNPEKDLSGEKSGASINGSGGAAKGAETGVAEEGFVVKAFTTGIFYAKPSPDAPPFVEVGQQIEKGKALGLIEVMKTFNHIVFQGTGTSTTGKVKKVFVKDSQEVKLGQPLFLID